MRCTGACHSIESGNRALYAHRVERSPYERNRNQEERRRQDTRQRRPAFDGKGDGQLNSQQPEQRGELDDRIERDRRRILEWIANGVADHSGGMQRSTLLFELYLDDFLCVVPGAASICHENRLEETE